MKRSLTTKKIVLTGLLAALTLVASYLRITMPVSLSGITSAFHLGNILCALSGILLGPWLGGLAAGLGSFIFDLLNPAYIADSWITFITKFAYGMVTGLIVFCGSKKWNYIKPFLGTIAGAVTYAALYLFKSYFYTAQILHGLTPDAALLTLIDKLPATIFNAAVAIVAAPLLALAIRSALKHSHLGLE